MSSHLLWNILKNNNSFLIKRNGMRFTKDPYSLSNIQVFSQSGIIRKDGLGITASQKDAAKANTRSYDLIMKKRQRYPVVSTQEAKKKKKQQSKLIDKQKLVIKNKIHTASKVIMKKYKNQKGQQKLALKRLVKLHKMVTAQKAASAQQKK